MILDIDMYVHDSRIYDACIYDQTWYLSNLLHKDIFQNIEIHLKQARKLQATLVRNYESLTYWRGWGVELLA